MSRRSLLDSILAKAAALHAGRITRGFFKAVAGATAAQDRLLAEILRTAAGSDFGREHHFDGIRSYADFVANVPIRPYAEFAPQMERVRRGEVGALFDPGQRILMFALTSGTTAEPKYIPITPRVLADCRRGWNVWGLKALLDHPGCMVRHIVQVTSPMADHPAPSGVPCGAITGLLAATQKTLVRRYYTAPLAVAGIQDSLAKYYTIMRLAIPKDVAWAVTANPSTLLRLARTADEHRDAMIRDIHDGTLSAGMAVEGEIRAALAPLLMPDPACANRLESGVGEHGVMYPKHYWRLGFLAHWTGGTMGLYLPQFPKYFGDVPSRDIGLIASEGRMSIPLDDGTPAGILAVTSQFFEFIPAEEYGTPKPSVLRSHEVRQGEAYFLVLTNPGGLYRYDIGDRVRVTDRVGQAPVIEFMSRDDHTASMAGEKLTEDQVVLAMQQVCDGEAFVFRNPQSAENAGAPGLAGGRGVPDPPAELGAPALLREPPNPRSTIVNFILAPRWADVPRYRLYVEAEAARDLDGLAERFDAALGRVSLEYASKRKTLRLEPVEAVALRDGALAERDRRLRRQRSRTSEQFKHQYLLPRPGLDADLEAGSTTP